MKIHEYQAKELMKARGISVPMGRVATTVDEAVAAVRPLIEESGNPVVVVKSQIHAGGRGKGRFKEHPDLGGVNVVLDGIEGGPRAAEDAVRSLAGKMLGSTLVTIQTGPAGKKVNRLYIEQGIDIDPTESVRYEVSTPAVDKLTLTGAGDFEVAAVTADRFAVVLSGANIDPGLLASVLDD